MKKAAGNTLCTSIATKGRPTGPRTRASPQPSPADAGKGAGGRSSAPESPYVSDDAVSIVLTGCWRTGGLLELLVDGQPKASFRFSSAPWSVLANLMLAAIHSQSSHWFNSHVATQTLADSLAAHDVLQDASPEKIYKLVNKIRNALAKPAIPKLMDGAAQTGKQWAALLIRSSKGPGYRIALPPKNLRLFIGETKYEPNGQQAREWEGCWKESGRQREWREDGHAFAAP